MTDTPHPSFSTTGAPRIEQSPPLRLVGLARDYALDDPGMLAALPRQWAEFAPRMPGLADQGTLVAFGVALPTQDPGRLRYMAAVPASPGPQPEDLEVLDLPASSYLVHPHLGHVSTLYRTVEAACAGREAPAGKPGFLEYYGPAFDPETGLGDLEVWTPLEDQR